MIYRCGNCEKDAIQVNLRLRLMLILALGVCEFAALYYLLAWAAPHPWVSIVAMLAIVGALSSVVNPVISRLTNRYRPYHGRALPD